MTGNVKNILMTGCTSNLGAQLLKFILVDRAQKINLFLLVRDTNKDFVRKKIWDGCPALVNDRKSFLDEKNIKIFFGDVTKRNLGLNKYDYTALSQNIDVVYHLAALTRFHDPFSKLKLVNVIGTQRVLDFISESKISPSLHYISSAFIAGDYNGNFKENDFDLGQNFNNPYEKSKFEAEKKVRKFGQSKKHIYVYRPSILVGEYRTGMTSDFQMFYKSLYLLSKELLAEIPVNRNTFLNIIPIDIAAKMIFLLSNNLEKENKTYHIVSPNPFNIIRIINFASEYFHFDKPRLSRVMKFKSESIKRLYSQQIKPFWNYFTLRAKFESVHTLNRLAILDFLIPKMDEEFLKRLFSYAVKVKYIGIKEQ